MKTKIFVDFDGTLFDTGKLRAQIYKTFEKVGFPHDQIDETYREECEDYRYSPQSQAERLCKTRECDLDELKKDLSLLQWDTKKWLYKDSIEFLRSLDREKYEIDLLTLGDVHFQKSKVDHSGLAHYFDNIYYSVIQKWDFLEKIVAKDEQFVIIDDRPDTLEEIYEKFPNSICIKISRFDKDESDDPVLEVKDEYPGPHVTDMFGAVKYLPQE